MLEEVKAQYEVIKAEFDEASQSEKDDFVRALNEFQEDLGTDFKDGEDEFKMSATDLHDIAGFIQLLKGFGLNT